MQKIISEKFKAKFYEVYDTPIAREPFTTILGLDGLTENSEHILTGTYIFPPIIHLDIIAFF